jgi:hypothetical protein
VNRPSGVGVSFRPELTGPHRTRRPCS